MAKQESNNVGERRFTLLTRLAAGPATIDQIKEIPAYAQEAQRLTDASLQRNIERDIETLRTSGHNVVNVGADGDYRYYLDDSRNVPVDGIGMDLTLLRHLLGYKASSDPEVFAQSGVTKLLGTGSLTDEASPYSLHVPTGEAVTEIAPAIQLGKRITFTYESASAGKLGRYVVEPWRIEVHFGAFYVRGYQVSKNSDAGDCGMRVFKLDRMSGKIQVLDDDATHPVLETESSHLHPVTARVFVADRRLPLAMKGTVVEERDGGVVVEIDSITRVDLFDDLIFHGRQATLLGPDDVAEEFAHRIDHLASLGGHDGR